MLTNSKDIELKGTELNNKNLDLDVDEDLFSGDELELGEDNNDEDSSIDDVF